MAKNRKRSLAPSVPLSAPFQRDELRNWRIRMAWTQEEAAGALGLNKRTYQNWEQGHRAVPFPQSLRMQIRQVEAARKRATKTRDQEDSLFD